MKCRACQSVLLSLLLSLSVCTAVPAKVLYVNGNAPGTVQDGASWSTAYLSILAAANSAGEGDEVWVARGTYKGSVVPKASLALYGGFAGTETQREQRDWVANPTVLDGQGSNYKGLVTSEVNGTVRVDGFTLRNADKGLLVSAGTAVLSHNVLTHNVYSVYVSAGAASLSDCTIAGSSIGAYVTGGSLSLTNDTVCGNGYHGVWVSGGTASLASTIVAFNSGAGVVREGTGQFPAFTHNDLFGNVLGNASGYTPLIQQGNISADPKLSSGYHDIHIQPDSPCRDAGDDAAVSPGDTDIDGQPRIQGAHVDIGADESDGTAWNVPSFIWHVSPDGSDANDGLTWATAKKTITAALSVARGGDAVWVAKGTYPEIGLKPAAGVALYGGFAGTEADLSQRDVKANPTVIDGGGTPYEIVVGISQGLVVDGFTIKNGAYTVSVKYGTVSLANCTVTAYRTGLQVVNGAADLTSNTFSGGPEYAVNITGTATLVNNKLASGNTTVRLSGSGTLAGNMITAGSYVGVDVAGRADLVGNTIRDGFGTGVLVESGAKVALTGNTISNNGDGVYFLGGGSGVLQDNTISGSSRDGVRLTSGGLTLKHNTITGNRSGGVDCLGGFATLTDNTITGNTGAGVSMTGTLTLARNTVSGNGVGVIAGGVATVRDNVITGNRSDGVAGYGRVTIANNTIAANGGTGVYLVLQSGTVTVSNSILAFNGAYGILIEPSQSGGPVLTVSHNDVFGNVQGDAFGFTIPSGMATLFADPLFVDEANADFHLQPGSPGIDAGDDAVLLPWETDRDGKPRRIGAHVDIGAYEAGAAYYTVADVAKALRLAGGILQASPDDLTRLNIEPAGDGINLSDALRLARKAAGLDVNP